MDLYRNKYRIQSNRLKDWDYSGKGMYFITLCCCNRIHYFGNVVNGKMRLNENGIIVSNEIKNSIQIREKWIFHNWVIMPNHLHLLIEIKEEQLKYNYSTKRITNDDIDIEMRNLFLNYSFDKFNNVETHRSQEEDKFNKVETHCSASQPENIGISNIRPFHPNPRNETKELYRRPKSISSFVAQFKSRITKQINLLEDSKDSIWQSNYHDSIVRNQKAFQNVYYYIQNNPKNWKEDSLNKK